MDTLHSTPTMRASRDQYHDQQTLATLHARLEAMSALRRIVDLGRTATAIGRLEDIIRARSEHYPDLPPYAEILNEIDTLVESRDLR